MPIKTKLFRKKSKEKKIPLPDKEADTARTPSTVTDEKQLSSMDKFKEHKEIKTKDVDTKIYKI